MRVDFKKNLVITMLIFLAQLYAIQNPLVPEVNPFSYYGPRTHRPKSNNHQGIDYAVKKVNVYAVKAGSVTWGTSSTAGKYIYLNDDENNNIVYKYFHLSKNNVVANGLNVSEGRYIGITGNTGNGNSWHLHFQVDQNGQPHHPLKYLPYTQGDYISHRVMEKDDESFTIKFITTPPYVDIDQIRFTIMQANNIPVDCVIALSPYDINKLNPTNGSDSYPTAHYIGNTDWTYELTGNRKEYI